ncbi:hypothetical protein GCM10020220_073420 [Nonomuraea rubra]|uniref:hypothetical protein n=1 Tax=Nonomuraea rubra TaxID=46180 RepID=UPI0031ECFD0A
MESKISPRQAFAPGAPGPPAPARAERLTALAQAVPHGGPVGRARGHAPRAPSQQAFIRAVKQQHADALTLKCHAYRNLTEVAGKLADWADWTTLTTRPTEQRIADDLDLALSTVKALDPVAARTQASSASSRRARPSASAAGNRCGLDDARPREPGGCLGAVRPGSRAGRPLSAYRQKRQLNPLLVLPVGEYKKVLRTRARKDQLRAAPKPNLDDDRGHPPTPGTRKHALQIAQKIHDASTTLRRLSPWYIRHLTRVFVAAGWTAGDVLHALDHQPDGAAWTYTWTSRDQIRNVPGWVRFRLSMWLDEHGRPLPGKSQRLAAAAAKLRAEQAVMREQFEAMNARRVGGPVELPPRLSRAEALAPPPVRVRGSGSGPSAAYRAARTALDEKRLGEAHRVAASTS